MGAINSINDFKLILQGVDNTCAREGLPNTGAHYSMICDEGIKFLEKKLEEIADEKISLYKAGKLNLKNSDELIFLLKNTIFPIHEETKKIIHEKFHKNTSYVHFTKSLNFEGKSQMQLDKMYIKLAGKFSEYQTQCKNDSRALKISKRANFISWIAAIASVIALIKSFL